MENHQGNVYVGCNLDILRIYRAMGAVNSVRRLTIQCISLLESLEPNKVEIATKQQLLHDMEKILRQTWSHLRLIPFGSSEK